MNIEPLVIEVFEDNVSVIERIIPPKGDRAEITLYQQIGFAHVGGRFPIEMNIPLAKGDAPYPKGKYHLHATSFEVGDYGKLNFARKMVLIPLAHSAIKSA